MYVRTATLVLLLLLSAAVTLADCVPPQTPPNTTLSLGPINGERTQDLLVTRGGDPVYGWTLRFRGDTRNWFPWYDLSNPHKEEFDVSCMTEAEMATLEVSGCERGDDEISVGPYDFTPTLAVKELEYKSNAVRASLEYYAPFSKYQHVRVESFNMGDATPSEVQEGDSFTWY
ncbi:MAG TPA: hypothetical protein VGF69_01605, partial [Thermoanaerobaculia bacterium]